ncbi:alpha/beta fold hydrolase [Yoonia sp. R2331]|uniref:alpha/beta fold hydrolase n=1 Tax=Yoonia sp. R2331 TaxID=3237238 RepID=UPI0034E4AE77
MFLHAVGTSGWMWQDVIAALPDLRCHTVDLPGHGRSAQMRWQSLPAVAEQVLSVIPSQKPVHLVTLSLGSYVRLHLLHHAPGRFASATLSGVHADGMPNKTLMKVMGALMSPFVRLPRLARMNAANLGIPDDRIDGYVAAARLTTPQAFRRASNNAVDFEAPDISGFGGRLLIAAGGKEHALIRDSQTKIAAMVPHGRAAQAPGLGHGWSGQNPRLFAEMVRAMVNNTALPEALVLL